MEKLIARPQTTTCNLTLGRTIKIMANDGEEVNADYQEDVNYNLGANCEPGEPCDYVDVKVITCTVNGCEVTETCTVNGCEVTETCTVNGCEVTETCTINGCEVTAQQSDLTLLSNPVSNLKMLLGQIKNQLLHRILLHNPKSVLIIMLYAQTHLQK